MADRQVDFFVIGGGSGGVRAARIAANYGAKVMLAEEFRMGGTCVIRGCVPKKLLVYASRFAHEFEDAAGFGWSVPQTAHDWPTLVAAKEREVTRLEAAYLATQEKAGVTVLKSRAVLDDPHTVRILASGEQISAKHILIATGGRPNLPPLPGVEHAISSNEAFDLKEFPRRIVIAGGGYIAIEFAGIFAGLGAEVTIIYRGHNILRGFDEDMRNALRASYERHGIRVLCSETIKAIDKNGKGVSVVTGSNGTISADQVMFAIGRSPNSAGMGLEEAGIMLDVDQAVAVDSHSRTSVDHVFAVGDVTNRVNLTPVAIREGHAVADLLFGGKNHVVDYHTIPTAVFSTPEIGTVGLSEAAAREKYDVVDVYKVDFRPMKATISGRQDRFVMKLLVDGKTDRVIGCHIFGESAGEMAQILGIVLRMGGTKADFDATMALHPSAAEELVTMRTRTARFEKT